MEADPANCSAGPTSYAAGAFEQRAREHVVSVGARYLAPSGRLWEVRSLLPHDRVLLTAPGPYGDCDAVVDVQALARMISTPLTSDATGTLVPERSWDSAQSAPVRDIGERVA